MHFNNNKKFSYTNVYIKYVNILKFNKYRSSPSFKKYKKKVN